MRPFHIAFPVNDLEVARQFYGKLMKCPEGRSASTWVDFNLYGHQIVAHLQRSHVADTADECPVDGRDVPVPHFGVILEMAQWTELAGCLRDGGVKFLIEPHIRFQGRSGEQATMFFLDPSGNALEFKAFADDAMIFAR